MTEDPNLLKFLNDLQLKPKLRDQVAGQLKQNLKRGDLKFRDSETGKTLLPAELDLDSFAIEWPEHFVPDAAIGMHIQTKDGRYHKNDLPSFDGANSRGYLWRR